MLEGIDHEGSQHPSSGCTMRVPCVLSLFLGLWTLPGSQGLYVSSPLSFHVVYNKLPKPKLSNAQGLFGKAPNGWTTTHRRKANESWTPSSVSVRVSPWRISTTEEKHPQSRESGLLAKTSNAPTLRSTAVPIWRTILLVLGCGWLDRWRRSTTQRVAITRTIPIPYRRRSLFVQRFARQLTAVLLGIVILGSVGMPTPCARASTPSDRTTGFASDSFSTVLGDTRSQRYAPLDPWSSSSSSSLSSFRPTQPQPTDPPSQSVPKPKPNPIKEEAPSRSSPESSLPPSPANKAASSSSSSWSRTPSSLGSSTTVSVAAAQTPPRRSSAAAATTTTAAMEYDQGLKDLQRNLLRQGLDPFRDVEGMRQVHFYQTGQDLARIPGTPQFLEQQWQQVLSPSQIANPHSHKRAHHRRLLRCWVIDLERRGIVDVLEYFVKHPHQLERLYRMGRDEANWLANESEHNLQEYGSITSAKIEARKMLEQFGQQCIDRVRQFTAKHWNKVGHRPSNTRDWFQDNDSVEHFHSHSQRSGTIRRPRMVWLSKVSTWRVPRKLVIPVATIVLGTGLALLFTARTAFTQPQEDDADEDFQRLYTLLTGDPGPYKKRTGGSFRAPEPIEQRHPMVDDGQSIPVLREATPLIVPVQADVPAAPTLDPYGVAPPSPASLEDEGLMSSQRPRDLYELVSNLAGPAAEFARQLAKVLALGAPDRLGHVNSLSGGALPAELTSLPYNRDTASAVLSRARYSAGLSEESSMELFDQIVKCLVTDVVEMETSWLQGQDSPTTVRAINDVVDFMAHVSSVYEALTRNFVVLSTVQKAAVRGNERAPHSSSSAPPAFQEPPRQQRTDPPSFLRSSPSISNVAAGPAPEPPLRHKKSRLERIHDTYSGTGGLY